MKYTVIILLALALFSCQRNSLNKEERKQYLKEHIKNTNIVIQLLQREIFYNLSTYRNNPISHILSKPVNTCSKFHDYLNDEAKLKSYDELYEIKWAEIKKKQTAVQYEIDSISSPFLRRIANRYILEKIKNSDSDELKLAKCFSNSERLMKSLYNANEHTKRYHYPVTKPVTDYFSLISNTDSILINDTLKVSAAFCSEINPIESIIIKQYNDIQIKKYDFSTGNIEINITGNQPSIRFIYDNANHENIEHEIIF